MTKAKWYFDFLLTLCLSAVGPIPEIATQSRSNNSSCGFWCYFETLGAIGACRNSTKTAFCLPVLSMEGGPAGPSICDASNASV